MDDHSPKHDRKIYESILNRIREGSYKVFDKHARVITRMNIEGKGTCLVIANRDGETFIIDADFENALRTALEKHDAI